MKHKPKSGPALKAFAAYLLQSANPGDEIIVADTQLQAAYRSAKALEDAKIKTAGPTQLTGEYAHIQPVIDAFIEDRKGWVEWVRNIRQHFVEGDKIDPDVQKAYRAIATRDHLRDRERRIYAAYDVATTNGYYAGRSSEAWSEYRRLCPKVWDAQKKERRDALRLSHGSAQKRTMTRDEVDDFVNDFWNQVDADIAQGNVPNPAAYRHLLTPPVKRKAKS